VNIARRELQLKEREQLISLGKFGIDKAVDVISNPAIALVGGFILTNLAQNKVIGYTTSDQKSIDKNWWNIIFPQWSLLIPDETEHTLPAGSVKTLLTEDQANIARAGLVALASSGLVSNLAGLVKGIK